MFSAYAETATMQLGSAATLDVTIPVLVAGLTLLAMGLVRLVGFLQRNHPTTIVPATTEPAAPLLEAA